MSDASKYSDNGVRKNVILTFLAMVLIASMFWMIRQSRDAAYSRVAGTKSYLMATKLQEHAMLLSSIAQSDAVVIRGLAASDLEMLYSECRQFKTEKAYSDFDYLFPAYQKQVELILNDCTEMGNAEQAHRLTYGRLKEFAASYDKQLTATKDAAGFEHAIWASSQMKTLAKSK